jgi:hypothetical protein
VAWAGNVWRFGLCAGAMALLSVLAMAWPRAEPARAEGPPAQAPSNAPAASPSTGPREDLSDLPPLPPVARAAEPSDALPPHELPVLDRPRAVARFEGEAAAGLKIRLSGEGSSGAELRFRWVQTEGPPVALSDPEAETAELTVPEGAKKLGFVLVVSNSTGIDTAKLAIPVGLGVSGTPSAGLEPRAAAGDDQIGLVGRQVTLNGVRSEPRGQIGYRWLQVGGPPVRLKLQDGYIFTFVPPAPGVYKFALVVALGSVISEPDVVSVSVGAPGSTSGPEAMIEGPEPIDEAARAALATIPDGLANANPLALAFEAIADRMDLYRSYAEVFSELSRRLEPILPADPARRGLWNDRLFAPMTARLIEALRTEGLDLRTPEGQNVRLTAPQRARLAEIFRAMAGGFRATAPLH